MTSDGTNGVCPSCERAGDVGQPCPERVCTRREVHCVPRSALTGQDLRRLDPMVGQTLDEYLIVRLLGAGGFGKVFLALQLPILLPAALKLLHHDPGDPALEQVKLAKFTGEAQALARLSHPHIVRLLKYGVYDQAPYMVMEFVEGGRTLKDEIAERAMAGRELAAADTGHILRQLLDGLEAAHARDIVHRDIKPENIMLQDVAGNPRFVRILDFGLAKFVAERTETSMAMGTPVYMAPEQMIRRHIGPWTDLYAVGCIAFEMMTGRRPFAGQTAQEIVASKLRPDYDPMSRLADLEVPVEAERFFRRALAVDHTARYRSAGEMRDALARVVRRLEQTHTVGMESVDLSQLLSATDQQRLVHQRAQLRAERDALAAERAHLEAERAALTRARASVSALDAATPTVADVTTTAPADLDDLRVPRRRAAPWLFAAAAAAVAIVIALVLSGGDPDRPVSRASAETSRVEEEEPPSERPEAVEKEGALDQDVIVGSDDVEPAASNDAVAASAEEDAGPTAARVAAADVGPAPKDTRRTASRSRDALGTLGRSGLLAGLAEDVGPSLSGTLAKAMSADASPFVMGHGAGGLGTRGTGLSTPEPETGSSARTTRAATRVRTHEPTVKGPHDSAVIKRYMRRNLRKFASCYEQGLKQDPELAGRITVSFTIGTNGIVPPHVVEVSQSSLNNKTVEDCIVAHIRRIRFPGTKDGMHQARVHYPFTFSVK